MKSNIKNTLYTGIAVVSSVVAMVSCSDTWDEHYSGQGIGLGDKTLMQSIEDNAPDFAKVIKAVKYDRELNSDNSYTVWAPQHFNLDSVLALAQTDSARVVKGFIKNHIARYAVPMDGSEKTVTLINNKYSTFNASKFATSDLLKSNIACSNGILHVIDNSFSYKRNIFELLQHQYEISDYAYKDSVGGSLYTFLRKSDADSLDLNKSVSRGYDDYGNQIWVDSVVIRNNTVLKNVDALIYEEDSNYLAILPSPKAYHERYLEYKKMLNFNQKLNENISVDGIDVCDSLANHYANMFAMNDLYYNMTNNEHFEDSLKSTTYLYSGGYKDDVYYRRDIEGQLKPTHDILAGLTPTECSNGIAYMVDEYPISLEEQNLYKIEYYLRSFWMAKDDKYYSNINMDVNSDNVLTEFYRIDGDKKQHFVYYNYEPVKSLPTYYSFSIPNYLACTYDISLVTVPMWVKDWYDGKGDFEPSGTAPKFNVYIYERNEKGVYPNNGSSSAQIKNYAESYDGKNRVYFYQNIENPIDTIHIGEYTFKNTYYGRGTDEESCGAMFQIKLPNKNKMLVTSLILTPKLKKDEETGNE